MREIGNSHLEPQPAQIELAEEETEVGKLPVDVDISYSFPNRESGDQYGLTAEMLRHGES